MSEIYAGGTTGTSGGKGTSKAAIVLLLMLVVATCSFVGGVLFATNMQRSTAPVESREFNVFWEAWQILEREFYYEIPSVEERTHGAIRGLAASFGDPFTFFLPPDIAEMVRENSSGVFGGIGAYLQMNDYGQVVLSPFPDSPAAQAGIVQGDIVLAVDGGSVEGMSQTEVALLIRGDVGTPVVLTIYRPSTRETIDVEIIRQQIEVPTVESEMLEGDIAYVHLLEFNARAAGRLRAELEELLAQEPRALILDLRGNPGGYLDQAVEVADLFLPDGVVVIQRAVNDDDVVYRSEDGDLAEDIPLVVLIDNASASASEIVAGAIRDRGRGVLIGQTSYGKGSMQRVHTLQDGSELRVTYGAWYTPNDQAIQGVGVEPDIPVEMPEEPATDEDPILDAALEYLNEEFGESE